MPAELRQKIVVLKADVSAHARKAQYRDLTCAPPMCVADVFNGKPARAPRSPLCAFGLSRLELKMLFGDEGHADWWGAEFELGRAPLNSEFYAAWRAFCESFAPIVQGIAPARRLSVKSRAAEFRGSPPAVSGDAYAMASKTVAPLVDLGVDAQELGELRRAYADGISPSVVKVIAGRDELVGREGTLDPLGVVGGMVFATVTRASYGARFRWFQALDWWRVSCMPRGLFPGAQGDKSALKSRPGFDDVVNRDGFDDQYGHIPAQPDDKSRVWGANSFVVPPMFEGFLQPEVAQQCG